MSVSPELLLQAYRVGVFPMAEHRDDPEIFWVDPRFRGIIPLDGFHVSRSLARRLRRDDYRVTLDRAFHAVMLGCADRAETWINDEILALYAALHESGDAHSLEVWRGEDLVGGVYGVALGAAFCGESMFSRMRDASKIALAWLVHHLRDTGFTLFDTQFLTPHLASLGGVEIPRSEYQALLRRALGQQARFGATPLPAHGHEVVQRSTHTS
ncbi:leucyl/phenylalanyl-tRNA--protein transferase [Roseivivax isoporae]|uniref:Leucyl/phenylalanyl-tRNA--protein transferase n=1 Tax=Roseivivax isoporae LMG 25204 TaxID=1449351 RepID=X7F3F7_9RHOB|nr:leucyl/phenylalanyl-tRNA--protein transferase [Roseivivax isoporae]ETX27345.1 leucyl/phenylalanyl-tRNA--protein transferase [Roseivivax isoporae LMG 25204]